MVIGSKCQPVETASASFISRMPFFLFPAKGILYINLHQDLLRPIFSVGIFHTQLEQSHHAIPLIFYPDLPTMDLQEAPTGTCFFQFPPWNSSTWGRHWPVKGPWSGASDRKGEVQGPQRPVLVDGRGKSSYTKWVSTFNHETSRDSELDINWWI